MTDTEEQVQRVRDEIATWDRDASEHLNRFGQDMYASLEILSTRIKNALDRP